MKKHFYVFLCMLLGVVLLLIIQRALMAIYIIVSDSYPAYDLLTITQLQMGNWATVALAVLIGLFYGNYLGHHWYPLVYGEQDNGKTSKLADKTGAAPALDPVQRTVTIKPVRVSRAKVSLRSEVKDEGWDFDDLLNHDAPAVESLSSSGPSITSAVSLGESESLKKAKPAAPAKKAAPRKTAARKPAVKTKTAATKKPTAKPLAKPAVKKAAPKAKAKVK